MEPVLNPTSWVTEDDFYRLAGEDSNLEYLDGGLWVREAASNRHEALFGFLLVLLTGFLDERGGGIVRGSRYPMRLDERWSPEPDLMVVRDEHLDRVQELRLEGPADLVIDIASAGAPRHDLHKKLPRYREAGIPEIWLVDPSAETVEVNRRQAARYETTRVHEGRLESPVVPGFWLDVGWLWTDPLPSTLACLRQIL
jgi:Uma2 family endonuclease